MVEKQFKRDFLHSRSCGAIRAAVRREAKKNRKLQGDTKRAVRRTAGSGPHLHPTMPVSLKTQHSGHAQLSGMLAEGKSEIDQDQFPRALTRNVLTGAVEAQSKQLHAERAASKAYDNDMGRSPVAGSGRGSQ